MVAWADGVAVVALVRAVVDDEAAVVAVVDDDAAVDDEVVALVAVGVTVVDGDEAALVWAPAAMAPAMARPPTMALAPVMRRARRAGWGRRRRGAGGGGGGADAAGWAGTSGSMVMTTPWYRRRPGPVPACGAHGMPGRRVAVRLGGLG